MITTRYPLSGQVRDRVYNLATRSSGQSMTNRVSAAQTARSFDQTRFARQPVLRNMGDGWDTAPSHPREERVVRLLSNLNSVPVR